MTHLPDNLKLVPDLRYTTADNEGRLGILTQHINRAHPGDNDLDRVCKIEIKFGKTIKGSVAAIRNEAEGDIAVAVMTRALETYLRTRDISEPQTEKP